MAQPLLYDTQVGDIVDGPHMVNISKPPIVISGLLPGLSYIFQVSDTSLTLS